MNEDFLAFQAFCDENGLDTTDQEALDAYEAHQNESGGILAPIVMVKVCKVEADPTGNTPLWDCDCPACLALEAGLNDMLGIEE